MSRRSVHKPAARQAGFTLLEMLVAIGLVSLLSLLTFTALRLGAAAWARTDARAAYTADVLVAHDLLRETIAQAYPALVHNADVTVIAAFQGTRDRLELSGPLPRTAAIGGLHRIRFALTNGEASQRLVMAWRIERNAPDLDASPGPMTEVDLLTGVRAVAFGYFGQRRGERVPRWHDAWENEIDLPDLVRVEVVFADAHERRWPLLTIAPRVDVDATCVIDLLIKHCRGR